MSAGGSAAAIKAAAANRAWPPSSSIPPGHSDLSLTAAAVDDEDVTIADLFQQSQQACTVNQQQRRSQRTHLQPQPHPQPQLQPHFQLTQPQHRQSPVDAGDNRVETQPDPRESGLPLDGSAGAGEDRADSLFSSIPGPIRRVWLQSQRSSDSRRSKRRRLHSTTVDLTSDELVDEWQRAADATAQRQPGWRTLIAQHCNLQALVDSALSPSHRSFVPCLFVRVDSLTGSSYAPSASLSSQRSQLVALARRQLLAAGVVRGRLGETDAAVASDAIGPELLLGYHSARVSDARCAITADVQDSLCRSVGGSSAGGVLSVGCYVLLSDVALLRASEGRSPHLLVQRCNVRAVQQPPQIDSDDTTPTSSQPDDEHAGTAPARNVLSTQRSAGMQPAVVSAGPAGDSAAAAAGVTAAGIAPSSTEATAIGGLWSDSWDMLDLGDD